MRIITENDAISEASDEEYIDFLDKHRNQKIHILFVCFNGATSDEFFIHRNIEKLKQFKDCNMTFEYEHPFGLTNSKHMFDYNNEHIDGKRTDGNTVFTIGQIIADEEFVLEIANEINSQNFSQLEKIFAIYNIATSIKSFRQEAPGSGNHQSRSLFEYLNNTYMVCAGYTNFLENICYLTNIPCYQEPVRISNGPHARLYVNITDEKYGINGYYVLDPTADNTKGTKFSSRLLNHFLMTTSKANSYIENTVLDDLNYKNINSFKDTYRISKKKYLLSLFEKLDKDFAEEFESLDLTKDDDIQKFLDYLDAKIDNEIDPDKIYQAKLVVASSIFKIPNNIKTEDFLNPPNQSDMTEDQYDFMKTQGYEDKPQTSIEAKYIERIKFLYDIMYRLAVQDFTNKKITITEFGSVPNSETFRTACNISSSFESKLNKLLKNAENPEPILTELRKNGFFITEKGSLDTDKQFDQMLQSAEKEALQTSNFQSSNIATPLEYPLSYISMGISTGDLYDAKYMLAATLRMDNKKSKGDVEYDSI